MGLIDQILLQGRDSRLYQAIVQKQGLTGSVSGGINFGLGNMFDIDGPILWRSRCFTTPTRPTIASSPDSTLKWRSCGDGAHARRTRDRELKVRSSLYGEEESLVGFGRANLLASFALFDDDPGENQSDRGGFAKVTPDAYSKTARRVPATDEPHDPDDYSEGQDSATLRRRCAMTRRFGLLVCTAAIAGVGFAPLGAQQAAPSATPPKAAPAKTFRCRRPGASRSPTDSRSRWYSGARSPRCTYRSPSAAATCSRARTLCGSPISRGISPRRHHHAECDGHLQSRSRAWAARLNMNVGEDVTRLAAMCCRSAAVTWWISWRMWPRTPTFPESELRAPEG